MSLSTLEDFVNSEADTLRHQPFDTNISFVADWLEGRGIVIAVWIHGVFVAVVHKRIIHALRTATKTALLKS